MKTLKLRGPLTRRVPIEMVARAEGADEKETDTYEIVVSTEDPVRRYDWWTGRFWFEVLGHDEAEVDMRYMAAGAAVLEEHRGPQIGVVERAWIDKKNKQLRARIRFSQVEPRAQIVEGKIKEGVMRHVSVGYSVDRYKLVEEDKEKGDTYRAARWTPYETSPVGTPADLNAGFGRATELEREFEVPIEGTTPKEERAMKKVRNDKNEIIEVADDDPRPAVRTATVTYEERDKQMSEVLEVCEAHGVGMAQARAWIAEGLNADQVSARILEGKRTKPTGQPASETLEGLTEKDRKRYSYSRAILKAAQQREGSGKFDGLEAEVHSEIDKRLDGTIARHGGIFVPLDLRSDEQKWQEFERRQAAKRALDSKTAGKGPETIFEEPGELIEILRQQAVAARLGARILTGLTAPVAFPKHTGRLQAFWVGENPASDVTESDLGFGVVNLQPKTVQASTAFSRQFLVQSSIDGEAMVRSELGEEHSLLIDRSTFHGEGAAGEPTGIYKAPDVNVRAVAGVPDLADVIDLIGLVADDNALAGTLGWVTTPLMAAKLRQILEFSAAGARPIWDGPISEADLGGYRAISSNQISKTMTGSEDTGGTEHGAIFGNWREVLIGLFLGLEIIVDPFAKKKRGLIEVTSFQMMDLVLRHGESFGKWTGATIA